MTAFEILSALANLAAAVAVVVGAWQLVLVHRQSITNFEDTFAKEYRDLTSKLPTKALLGEALTDDEHAKHFDEMYHYFDLCNEQAFLRSIGRVSNKTWTFWKDGIASNLGRPAFDRAWSEIAARANDDFSELKALFPPKLYDGRRHKSVYGHPKTLEADGFLSDDAPLDVMHVAPEFAPFSLFADKLNRFALSVIKKPRAVPRTLEEVLPIALAGRLLQDFEAAVILANRGFRAQSRSMARATLETAFYCTASCRNAILTKGTKAGQVAFLDAFLAGHEQFRRRMSKELAALLETTNEHKIRLNDLYQELSDAALSSGIDVRGLADDLGFSDMYTVLYRPLSQDSHPSPTSVEHHITTNEVGALAGFRVGPDYDQYADTIVAAAAAILLGLDAYVEKFGDEEERQTHAQMASEYKSIANAVGA